MPTWNNFNKKERFNEEKEKNKKDLKIIFQ